MPRIDHLTRLFNAVARGDLARARVLAGEMAEHEEQAGKPGSAASLRKALVTRDGAREDTSLLRPTARIVAPELVTELAPAALEDVALTSDLAASMGAVVQEHRRRGRLAAHGIAPRNRLLFHGPPGCGKTLTARALGGALGLQVFVVRFDALLGAYLGQTSSRVHDVFRFAAAHECILLLDEIDAIGRRRGHTADVGELDRVVISLMQQLDLLPPAGLIIAASNVPDDLDPALRRRFDLQVEFPAPERQALDEHARRLAQRRGVALVNGVAHALGDSRTFADVDRILVDEQRRMLLREG